MLPAPLRQSKDGWLLDTLRSSRAGSNDALHEAFRSYLFLVAARAGDVVPPSKDARSDLVASAVHRAVDDFGEFRGQTPEELAGWLRGIRLQHISDVGSRYRADKRDSAREVSLDAGDRRLPEQLPAPHATPEQALLHPEDAQRVRVAPQRLAGPCAQALLLRQRDGLPFNEVGRRLGRSAESTRKPFGRALKQLYVALEPTDGG
jgi:RNA polymerase sigma-70 factor (ECF subfamily)